MTDSFRSIITSKFDKDISLDYSEWSNVVNNSDCVLVPHLRSTVDYYV